jgi:hypothetical protein
VTAGQEKASGTIAIVAGLIAVVKLARVESREIESRSPRVRAAILDAVSIARMVIEASKINSLFVRESSLVRPLS